MTDLEKRLEQALKADALPPHDPMFRIEILVRRERAAFRRKAATAGAMALGAAIIAWLGLAVVNRLASAGPERAALIAAATIIPFALLLAFCAGGLPMLQSAAARWRARAASILRAMSPYPGY